MTEMERHRLRFYRLRYGSMMPANADEALAMAIDDELMGAGLSPFDAAKLRFLRGQREMEEIALLLEKEHASKQNP